MSNSNNTPMLTVITSVYRNAEFIEKTVDSILKQTFTDFEYLIVDDCGGDGSIDLVKKITDERIKLIINEQNIGFMKSLNRAIDQAQGKYIAIMDGDDVCPPERFEKQIDYLEKHPDIGLLGSAASHIDEHDKFISSHKPLEDDASLRFQMIFIPSFYHPSAMMRRSVMEENNIRYDDKGEYKYGGDYNFWTKMLNHSKIANLSDILLYYRKHSGAETAVTSKEIQNKDKALVGWEQFKKDFGDDVIITKDQFIRLSSILNGKISTIDDKRFAMRVLPKIHKEYIAKYPDLKKGRYLCTEWVVKIILRMPNKLTRARCLLLLPFMWLSFMPAFILGLLPKISWKLKAYLFKKI